MSKPAKTASLVGLFTPKGEGAPTTPVVAAPAPVKEDAAPEAVTVELAEAVPQALPPAPPPVAPKAAPKPPKAAAPKPEPAAAKPTPKELGGALISTTVKLDQGRYREVKMAGVLSGKTFQDIAVEAIDLWLAANANQG